MENKFIENWQEYTKNAVAAAKELESINTQIMEKITSKQMELANVAFESSTKYISTMAEVKGYQELVAEQTKLTSEFSEKLIEMARSTADIMTESREAYQAWMEKSLKALTANTDFMVPTFVGTKKIAPKKAA